MNGTWLVESVAFGLAPETMTVTVTQIEIEMAAVPQTCMSLTTELTDDSVQEERGRFNYQTVSTVVHVRGCTGVTKT